MRHLARISLLTIGVLIFCDGNVRAQLIPVLGGQRAGTAMATFLKIGVGARAEGMGGAFVAVGTDATALYWNPAAVAQSPKNELVFSHTNWPVEIRHEFLGYVQHLGSGNHVGLYAIALHTDDMEETTEFRPLGTGNFFTYGDLAVGLTFARNMTDRFSFGITVKGIRETLAEVHATGVLLDFGTFYWTGWRTARFAVSVSNFGPNLRPSGSLRTRQGKEVNRFQDFPPPTIFRIGFATELWQTADYQVTTSLQLNHPNDDAENLNVGIEYGWRRILWLRGGYRLNVDEQRFTFGFGLRLPVSFADFRLQYAYTEFGRLGTAQRITACFAF